MYTTFDNGAEVMDTLRRAIYERDPELLAYRIGVSKSTILRIRSGKTKWPREATLFSLISACNMQLALVGKKAKVA